MTKTVEVYLKKLAFYLVSGFIIVFLICAGSGADSLKDTLVVAGIVLFVFVISNALRIVSTWMMEIDSDRNR